MNECWIELPNGIKMHDRVVCQGHGFPPAHNALFKALTGEVERELHKKTRERPRSVIPSLYKGD